MANYGKSRAWIFTINNYTKLVRFDQRYMTYLLYAEQIGEKGTPHLQGYVQWASSRDLRSTQQGLGHGKQASCKIARGSADDNLVYIGDGHGTNQKPAIIHGTPDPKIEEGTGGAQGLRTDLLRKGEEIVERKLSLEQAAFEWPDLVSRYKWYFGLCVMKWKKKPRVDPTYPLELKWFIVEKPDVKVKKRHWFVIGPADMGKTRTICTALKGINYFMCPMDEKYRFEMYKDEDIIIYDDCIPTEQEVKDVSNTWEKTKGRVGGHRYSTAEWNEDHSRTMIVLTNVPGPYMEEDWFYQRFNVINLYDKAPAALQGGPHLLIPLRVTEPTSALRDHATESKEPVSASD
nr:MAG: replication associated protein [Cressdnaviricota sp.]